MTKRFTAYRFGRYYFVRDNQAGTVVDDFATPGGDVETTFRSPREAMKLAATLNADPDMPRPQTTFHKRIGVLLGGAHVS
jgi:hypothetical protein